VRNRRDGCIYPPYSSLDGVGLVSDTVPLAQNSRSETSFQQARVQAACLTSLLLLIACYNYFWPAHIVLHMSLPTIFSEKLVNSMSTVSIGIDYSGGDWKLCLLEDGEPSECLRFSEQEQAFRWLSHTSALYPEPTIGLSSLLDCAFCPLSALAGHLVASSGSTEHALPDFLISLSTLSRKGYGLPSLKYVASIPAYRRLLHTTMGTPDTLCSVATLLYRMRQSQASWAEMRFLCLEVGPWYTTINVVQDGRLVDSMVSRRDIRGSFDLAVRREAFWEGLLSDLGGLMAVHHFEDIVISQKNDSAEASVCKEQIIERLGDLYQCYLYPQSEHPGFEACIGAALLVAGLSSSSSSAELTSRLLVVVP
jgi:Protein of unknown function (DUF1464)